MKILITTDWSEQAVNGVAASVKNLRRGLQQAGHEVKVLTLSGDHHSRMEGDTYYVGSMSAGAVYPNARLKLLLPHDWVDELLEWKPDIVHSQCILCTFPLAKEIASACNVPLVNTYHTVYEDFTHYICPSRTVGRELVRLYTKAILMNTQAVVAPPRKYGSWSGPSTLSPLPSTQDAIHRRTLRCGRASGRNWASGRTSAS